MILARALRLVLAVIALGYSTTAFAAQCGEQPETTPFLRITQQQDLLTLEARNARLVDVLDQLGEHSGFTIRQFAGSGECTLVNASFDRRPLVKIVEQLVADTNRIIFYAPGGGANPQRSISQVWLLGSASGDDVPIEIAGGELADGALDDEDPSRRSEAVLKLSRQVSVGMAQDDDAGEEVLARVGQVLQQDPDPLVRSRAAIALGALNLETAVDDLEIALRDDNFTVRSQAIAALGQIGGDRASTALGSILVDPSIDAVERVMAAQALWRHGTETALGYLLLGADDENAQVREASSRAPVTAATGQASGQSAPANTE